VLLPGNFLFCFLCRRPQIRASSPNHCHNALGFETLVSPVMTNTASISDVRRALDRARNSDDGRVDPQISTILETAIGELWRKIQAQPDSYVLSRDEFALFNYFRERFRGSPIAQRAVERFWNNFHGDASGIDGYAT
jgi:hypothetical protein